MDSDNELDDPENQPLNLESIREEAAYGIADPTLRPRYWALLLLPSLQRSADQDAEKRRMRKQWEHLLARLDFQLGSRWLERERDEGEAKEKEEQEEEEEEGGEKQDRAENSNSSAPLKPESTSTSSSISESTVDIISREEDECITESVDHTLPPASSMFSSSGSDGPEGSCSLKIPSKRKKQKEKEEKKEKEEVEEEGRVEDPVRNHQILRDRTSGIDQLTPSKLQEQNESQEDEDELIAGIHGPLSFEPYQRLLVSTRQRVRQQLRRLLVSRQRRDFKCLLVDPERLFERIEKLTLAHLLYNIDLEYTYGLLSLIFPLAAIISSNHEVFFCLQTVYLLLSLGFPRSDLTGSSTSFNKYAANSISSELNTSDLCSSASPTDTLRLSSYTALLLSSTTSLNPLLHSSSLQLDDLTSKAADQRTVEGSGRPPSTLSPSGIPSLSSPLQSSATLGMSLQEALASFMTLFRATFPDLYAYFDEEEVNANEWIVSWLQWLLSKELPLDCLLRLWDFYFAEGTSLHLFVCLAIVGEWREEITELEDVELKGFLQHLPTMDMDRILRRAVILKGDMTSSGFV